jgi:hypothetical protein
MRKLVRVFWVRFSAILYFLRLFCLFIAYVIYIYIFSNYSLGYTAKRTESSNLVHTCTKPINSHCILHSVYFTLRTSHCILHSVYKRISTRVSLHILYIKNNFNQRLQILIRNIFRTMCKISICWMFLSHFIRFDFMFICTSSVLSCDVTSPQRQPKDTAT